MAQAAQTFGEQLRRLREQRGWTQAQLAERAGVDRVSIARYETAARAPDFETACRLADALGVKLERLRPAK